MHVLFLSLSSAPKNRAWAELHVALEMLIQPCVAIHFRCPEGKEIVQNCNATMDLGCGLPDQGLVHKYHSAWFVGSVASG